MFHRLLQSGKPKNHGIFGDRRIHLHLGAHKTATTYIQEILAANKDTLRENGVLYLPLAQTRAKLSKQIMALSRATRDPGELESNRQAILDELRRKGLERCHTVLISDENLSGNPGRFKKGTIYNSIPDDWKHVHEELGPNIKVSFSIRDYPGFLTSIYSEILRRNRYFPFKKIMNLYGESPSLWSGAYRGLSTAFGEQNVTLWDFKDTVAHPGKVLAMLTGIDAPMEIISTPVRESLSKKAIEFIRDFQKLPGKDLPPDLIAEVGKRLYPLEDHPEKFAPFGADERAALLARYEAEKARLPVMKF